MAEINNLTPKEIMIMILALIVYGLTFILKIPIKKLTNKIQDEHTKKIANKSILLIPFALGVLVQYVYSVSTKTAFDYQIGLTIGLTSVSIYAMLERTFKGKKTTEYTQGDGKQIVEIVQAIAEKDNQEEEKAKKVSNFKIKQLENKAKRVEKKKIKLDNKNKVKAEKELQKELKAKKADNSNSDNLLDQFNEQLNKL